MKTFKMTNGINTIETNDFLMNIWVREGYSMVEESEEPEEVTKDAPTYLELKSMAKEKGINTHGMKKEDILEALGM